MILLAAAVAVSTAAAAADSSGMTAKEFIDRANALLRGASSHAKVSMTVQKPEWSRTMDIESWNSGRDRALIVVHGPAKDKGTSTLRRGTEMWLWMPRVERVIKVPPTMMHSSWMGSNFTYDDIVKSDSILKDYTHKVLSRKPVEDHEYVCIEALPKPEAPVVWGRVVMCGLAYAPGHPRFPDGYAIAQIEEDYSERGELIRTIRLSQVKEMDGRWVPTRLECEPKKKEGEKTIVEYHMLDFDMEVPSSLFSLERLQKEKH